LRELILFIFAGITKIVQSSISNNTKKMNSRHNAAIKIDIHGYNISRLIMRYHL